MSKLVSKEMVSFSWYTNWSYEYLSFSFLVLQPNTQTHKHIMEHTSVKVDVVISIGDLKINIRCLSLIYIHNT